MKEELNEKNSILVKFNFENIRLDFNEALRLSRTYKENFTAEEAFDRLNPIDKKSFNKQQLLKSIRETWIYYYEYAVPYSVEEILVDFKGSEELKKLVLKVISGKN